MDIGELQARETSAGFRLEDLLPVRFAGCMAHLSAPKSRDVSAIALAIF